MVLGHDLLIKLFNDFNKIRNDSLLVSSVEERKVNEVKQDNISKRIEKLIIDENLSPYVNYPYFTDPKFNEMLHERTDINIWTSPPYVNTQNSNKSITKFRKTDSQQFARSFMHPNTPFNSIILWHGTGVGKTCTAIGIAEEHKSTIYKQNKKIWIVCPKAVKGTWYSEIFNVIKAIAAGKHNVTSEQCTGSIYTSVFNILKNENKTIPLLEKQMQKFIQKYYCILNYEKFVKLINEMRINSNHEGKLIQKIKDHFSNGMLIVDEVHIIRNKCGYKLSSFDTLSSIQSVHVSKGASVNIYTTRSRTDKPIKITKTTKRINGVVAERIGGGDIFLYGNPNRKKPCYKMKPDETIFKVNKNIAKAIVDVLRFITRHSDGLKLILMSATPMYNSFEEITELVNLCRLNDKRPIMKPTSLFNNFEKSSLRNKLIPFTRGYISYVRGADQRTFPHSLYPKMNKRKTHNNIYYYLKLQSIIVCVSPLSDIQYELLKTRIKSSDIDSSRKMISSFVFQDDNIPLSFNNKNFHMIFKSKSKTPPFTQPYCGNQSIFGTKHMRKYSPKYLTLLDHINKCNGIVFVYVEYMATGAYSIAMMLEQNGYTRHSLQSPVLSNPINVISKEEGSTYILFDSSKQKNVSSLLKVINDPKNKRGSNVKVIIGTKRIEQGISFKNVRQIHIMTPWFNMNRNKQIIGRGARTLSHILLPEKERNLTIFYHVTAKQLRDGSLFSTDINMYEKALKKQKKIDLIEGILKENSVNCISYSDINMDKSNTNNTMRDSQNKKRSISNEVAVVDIQRYRCFKAQSNSRSNSSHKYMSNKITFEKYANIADEIRGKIFDSSRTSLSFDEINKRLKTYFVSRKLHVNILPNVLHLMISNRLPVIINGREGIIIFRDGLYMFNPTWVKSDTFIPNVYRKIVPRQSNRYINFTQKKSELRESIWSEKKTIKKLIHTLITVIPKYIRDKYSQFCVKGTREIKPSYTNDLVEKLIIHRQCMYIDSINLKSRLGLLHAVIEMKEHTPLYKIGLIFYGSNEKPSEIDQMYSIMHLKEVPKLIKTSNCVFRCITKEGQFDYFDSITHKKLVANKLEFWKSCFSIQKHQNIQQVIKDAHYAGFMKLSRNFEPSFKVMSKDSDSKGKNPKRGCSCSRGQGLGNKHVIEELINSLKKNIEPKQPIHSVHGFKQSRPKMFMNRSLCEEIELLLRLLNNKNKIIFVSLRKLLYSK